MGLKEEYWDSKCENNKNGGSQSCKHLYHFFEIDANGIDAKMVARAKPTH